MLVLEVFTWTGRFRTRGGESACAALHPARRSCGIPPALLWGMSFRFGAPDRRTRPRGVPPAEPHRPELVSRILGSYREMPGLSLQPAQAGRLFGISLDTCHVVFDELV